MDLKNLKVIADVARSGSFAETARRCDLDPSSVSRLVASTENALGFKVFQRSTRALALTDTGKHYLERIQPLLAELDAAALSARDADSNVRGQLTLTASVAFGERCLMSLMPAFRQAYPDVSLRLRFTDENVDLLSENIDLACRLTPAFQSDLVGIKLFDTRYRVMATPEVKSQLSQPDNPDIADVLRQVPIVALDLPHYRNAWRFVGPNGDTSAQAITPDILVNGALTLRSSLQMGLGAGLIADWLVDDLEAQGTLVDVFPHYRVTATDFDTAAWLLYPSRQFLPAKTQVAVDFFKAHLQRRGAHRR